MERNDKNSKAAVIAVILLVIATILLVIAIAANYTLGKQNKGNQRRSPQDLFRIF